jgi:biopolymer transport protein ExbD
MAMGGGGKPGAIKSEINITPLVDVVLVLLIIFMVVTPELQRGKEVHLPVASTAAQRKDGGDPVIISIKADKTMYVEQEETPLDGISDRIKEVLDRLPGTSVIIKGDSELTYGDVKALINEVRKSGAPGVSLAASTPEGK